MAPGPNEPGWDRWCGQHEARIDGIEDDLKAFWEWKEHHESDSQRRHLRVMERLTSVETKLIFFAAIAAAIGSMLPGVFAAIVKHL